MSNPKAIFVFPDYYDSTTASKRVLLSSKTLFSELKFAYWARQGMLDDSPDTIFSGIEKVVFVRSAPPRSIKVLFLFISFQWWIFKQIYSYKPDFIQAFTFYTVIPCLIYKYFFAFKCKVLYDPRDYVSVSYYVNKVVGWGLNMLDNICIKLADMTIFPDNQYFIHYGKFYLKPEKYFIMPNSSEDSFSDLRQESTHSKYNISVSEQLIPIIGYYSETRGRYLIQEMILKRPKGYHFIVAGVFRSQEDVDFFTSNDNVTFLGKITYLEALAIMRDSLVVPLLYDPALFNNTYAFPTKYYDALMVDTPVMVTFGQVAVWEDVRQNNVGFGVRYNNVEDFVEMLEALKSVNFERGTIRRVFLEKYDYEFYKDLLRQRYKTLLDISEIDQTTNIAKNEFFK